MAAIAFASALALSGPHVDVGFALADLQASAALALPDAVPAGTGVSGVLDGTQTNGTIDGDAVARAAAQSSSTEASASGMLESLLDFAWIRRLVETATGWVGLGIIAVYSFLIAFILPLPSEVVLVAPLDLGVPRWLTVGLVIVVSGLGKAAGSLFAFHLGQEAKQAGPVIRLLQRSRFEIVEWSQKQTVAIAKKWGYLGLALALCVPGFPDTISIYAFSVLEEDYVKFAVATFAGSVGRLVLWAAGTEAIIATFALF